MYVSIPTRYSTAATASTWNGATLIGWYRVPATAGTKSWDNAIDEALSNTFGGITGCRLPNIIEAASICDYGSSSVINYPPFNLNLTVVNQRLWTSTTNPSVTSGAQVISAHNGGDLARVAKTTLYSYIPVRTFSLSTLNVLS